MSAVIASGDQGVSKMSSTTWLSARLSDVLHDYRVVGHGRAFPISANALKSAFNRARHKLGLDHYQFRDIRHELISSFIAAS
ncbi:MAG: hypothetical protein HYX37_07595 [Rhizobiales bacterium]|nr:hypothetical protein [Hyphomicrobiales bacterium]